MTDWIEDPPDDSEPKDWHGLYVRAWEALRFDRQYGAMGGETPLSYAVLRRYADVEGIGSDDWPIFRQFMTAIDDEWLQHLERCRAARSGAAAPGHE